jgi:predicted dehydrogenase
MAATSRRKFFVQSALAASGLALPTIIPARALGRDGATAPSERITLGVIGYGPRCRNDLKQFLEHSDVQCLALADVQAKRRDEGKKVIDEKYGNTDCKTYRDLRELLARKDIDAVLIATGDRWHAPATMLAAEAGKDVYSEKPCGLTIDLCQRLDDTIKRTKRVFQAGTQRRSQPQYAAAVELARSGKLGKLQTLYASNYQPNLRSEWLPGEPTPPRDEVDWNLWLGTAPWRPYNSKYVNGDWRGFWDFDSGARLLDWGAHTLDLCQFANQSDDTMPIEYVASEDKITCTYASGVKVVLDFLKNAFGDRSPHYITRLGTCPVRFAGSEGSVEVGDAGEVVITPTAGNEQLANALPQLKWKRPRGTDIVEHSRNFLDCVKSRQAPVCNSTVMRRSHIACHAASFAWLLQRPVRLDPVKEEFIDDAEANSMRVRAERDWRA